MSVASKHMTTLASKNKLCRTERLLGPKQWAKPEVVNVNQVFVFTCIRLRGEHLPSGDVRGSGPARI